MSLKSFDKFCENIISGKSGSQKDVFDERQNQIRTKLTLEAVCIYAMLTILNTLVMERAYKWCDSFLAPMILFMALCYTYWIVRNHMKGTMFGINGTFAAKWSASCAMLQSFFMVIYVLLSFEESDFFYDGKISEQVLFLVSFVLLFTSGLVVHIMAKKNEKKQDQ